VSRGPAVAPFRFHRGDAGAALLMVLAATAFVSIVVSSLLGFSITGLKVERSVVSERDAAYATTSAMEAAIQRARRVPWIGNHGQPCPATTLTLHGTRVLVACQSLSRPGDQDRTLRLTARIDAVDRLSATVVIHDAPKGERAVDVVTWSAV